MPPALIILALAAAAGYYLIGRIPESERVAAAETTLQPTDMQRRLGGTFQALSGFIEDPDAGGLGMGIQIGGMVSEGGATFVEAGLAASAVTAMLGAGPVGVALAAVGAVFVQNQALMNHVAKFRALQFMLHPIEQDKWSGMKKKTTTWPTSAEPARHRALNDYEKTLIKKYGEPGGDGQMDFERRAGFFLMTGIKTMHLTDKGILWLREQGFKSPYLEIVAVQQPIEVSITQPVAPWLR